MALVIYIPWKFPARWIPPFLEPDMTIRLDSINIFMTKPPLFAASNHLLISFLYHNLSPSYCGWLRNPTEQLLDGLSHHNPTGDFLPSTGGHDVVNPLHGPPTPPEKGGLAEFLEGPTFVGGFSRDMPRPQRLRWSGSRWPLGRPVMQKGALAGRNYL